jgi:hypothetical protein
MLGCSTPFPRMLIGPSTRAHLILEISADLEQPRRPRSGDGLLQARTSLQGSPCLNGRFPPELICKRKAEGCDRPVSVLARNRFEAARDQPTLRDFSATMKVEAVFNPVVEHIIFGKTHRVPGNLQTPLVAA